MARTKISIQEFRRMPKDEQIRICSRIFINEWFREMIVLPESMQEHNVVRLVTKLLPGLNFFSSKCLERIRNFVYTTLKEYKLDDERKNCDDTLLFSSVRLEDPTVKLDPLSPEIKERFFRFKYLKGNNLKKVLNNLAAILKEDVSVNKKLRYFVELVPENQKFRQLLKLTELEVGLLGVLYIQQLGRAKDIEAMKVSSVDYKPLIKMYSVLCETTTAEINEILDEKNKLMSLGIVQKDTELLVDYTGINWFYVLTKELFRNFTHGFEIEKYLGNRFRTYRGRVFPLDSFSMSEEKIKLCSELLTKKKNAQILFCGKPGTGKSEFARSLVRSLGKEVAELIIFDDDSSSGRLSRLLLSQTVLQDTNYVLIVDEADDMLNYPKFLDQFSMANRNNISKAYMNWVFDSVLKMPVIWITNTTEGMDESLKRRFDLALEFAELSEKTIVRSLEVLVNRHETKHLFSREQLQELARYYKVAPGVFERYMLNIKLLGLDDSVQAHKKMQIFLDGYMQLANLEKQNSIMAVSGQYNPELINCIPSIKQVQQYMLSLFNQFERDERKPGDGVNVLLHGAPGTGKTEFVRWLGNLYNYEVQLYRGSDLQSKWVGETEKQIARMFQKASTKNTIILVDEADSFFIRREQALRSWEVSVTNEFLNQMENHQGIVFYCTNFEKNLDAAAMRRFHWKVHFGYPNYQQRLELVKSYFQDIPLPARYKKEFEERLRSMENLTPGDVRAVFMRYRFAKPENMIMVLDELEHELKYKEEPNGGMRRIGF